MARLTARRAGLADGRDTLLEGSDPGAVLTAMEAITTALLARLPAGRADGMLASLGLLAADERHARWSP